MKNLILGSLILLLCSCASIPKNTFELEPYAVKNFKHSMFEVSGKVKPEGVLREFAKKCIPPQVVIHKEGRGYKGLPSDHFIKFKTEIVTKDGVTSLYVQKDIGSMIGVPDEGMYFIWVKVDGKNTVHYYWMDSYGFRGPEILHPLTAWLTTNGRACPDLAKDLEFAR